MAPTDFLVLVVCVLLGGVIVLAVVSIVRGFRAERPTVAKAARIPFVDFPPPPPVYPSANVSLIGWLAAIWAAFNLMVGFLWFTTRFGLVGAEPAYHIAAIYAVVAAVISGLGGILLLGARAQGRRLIAWGGFLFVTLAALAFALSLMMWGSPRTTLTEKSAAMTVALLTGVHLAIDTVIATAAQHVGLTRAGPPPLPADATGEKSAE